MAATKAAVLAKAASQIGVKESPAGSNKTKFGAWYGLNGVAWCAIFVSWVAAQVGALDIIPKHSYTPAGADWFKARGRWYTKPQSGDLVFFNFPGDGVNRISHVGFVESVRSNGDLVTIEGNTSTTDNRNGGQVMRRVRNPRYAVGYGRPAYVNVKEVQSVADELYWLGVIYFATNGKALGYANACKAEGIATPIVGRHAFPHGNDAKSKRAEVLVAAHGGRRITSRIPTTKDSWRHINPNDPLPDEVAGTDPAARAALNAIAQIVKEVV